MKEETMKSGDVSVEVEEKATNEFAELKEEKKKEINNETVYPHTS